MKQVCWWLWLYILLIKIYSMYPRIYYTYNNHRHQVILFIWTYLLGCSTNSCPLLYKVHLLLVLYIRCCFCFPAYLLSLLDKCCCYCTHAVIVEKQQLLFLYTVTGIVHLLYCYCSAPVAVSYVLLLCLSTCWCFLCICNCCCFSVTAVVTL